MGAQRLERSEPERAGGALEGAVVGALRRESEGRALRGSPVREGEVQRLDWDCGGLGESARSPLHSSGSPIPNTRFAASTVGSAAVAEPVRASDPARMSNTPRRPSVTSRS